VYTILIGVDRVLKIAVIPLAVIFLKGFDSSILIAQSLVLLCYSLLSAGRDAVFVKRIFNQEKQSEKAFDYRLRTLIIFSPFIFLFLYFSTDANWLFLGITCLVALFGGCFDVFDTKLQAQATYKKYLKEKVLITAILYLLFIYFKSSCIVFAPYVFSPIYHIFKFKNLRLNDWRSKVILRNAHFTKYFYGALMCLIASKYELILSLFAKNNYNSVDHAALINRLADLISFIFIVLTIRHAKTISNGALESKRIIDFIVKFSFFFSVILISTLIYCGEKIPILLYQSLIGIELGICYGVGGLMAYVWAGMNSPKILLTIGAISMLVLFGITLPVYFKYGFSVFIILIIATQIILTFIPYFKYRKKWLSL